MVTAEPALFLLLEQLDLANLAGTLVAVPMLNPAAFMAGTRGDPLDTFSYDLNRIYPGRADGYVTERLAHAHWEAMRTSAAICRSRSTPGATTPICLT